MGNMTIKVRDSVREVVATYTIDEGSMELVVSLPSNHPLGGLTVESGRRVGVDTGQWRKWMLQLTTFLTHQNGTILDGLKLLKRGLRVWRSVIFVSTFFMVQTTSFPS